MQLVRTTECTQLHFQVTLNLSHLILKIHRRGVFFGYKLSEGPKVRKVVKFPVAEVLLFLVHESLELYHFLKAVKENWERERTGFIILNCTT